MRYEVHEQLATGGMGVVYRVYDRVARGTFAMKRLIGGADSSPLMQEAFEREFHVLASLKHPRIIRVFDYGVDEHGPFYTMELIEGEDMRRAAPLPVKRACSYLRDIATSLSLLHARRIIHRDLSPGNVRTTGDGHCKLLDFGALAAFGHARIVVGTPPVVPPEALDGAALDQRADLYSLGALAYWMLTGRHAYPAREIAELRGFWRKPLAAPSTFVREIPASLDALVLSLLSADPLARPVSAAEVIARLEVVGGLPPTDTAEGEHLAQSFLASPRFTGRDQELQMFLHMLGELQTGAGGAVCVQAASGMGRSRLLEEVGLRAQLAGVTVVRADASMYGQLHGTARALALRLVDAVPDVARRASAEFRASLAILGADIEQAVAGETSLMTSGPARPLASWFTEVSRTRPLMIQVDNVDYADDPSLGLLASLAHAAAENPIVLVTTECRSREPSGTLGLIALRKNSHCIRLDGLSAPEMFELVRSLFGDAPNVERLAEWLHERSAGSPLHAIEICRQLAARRVIRYSGGLWTLPLQRPEAALPAALGEAMSVRLSALSAPARSLVECLSLQHEQPTLALCRLLSTSTSERELLDQLDELARCDVLFADLDGYRFSSTAVRQALLAEMDETRLQENHRRLGEAFARLAGDGNPALRLSAGWHLIEGGDEERGAEMIAALTHDGSTLRTMMSNLHRAGTQLAAAMRVYADRRRSLYERMPLLSTLAQAGFCEDRSWGERYGDQALDAVSDLSGVRTAQRLRRFIGGWPALLVGLSLAWFRYLLTPKVERPYGFQKVLIHLFTTVAALTGAAALSLDAKKASHVASTLKPFDVLPERFTPAGVYQYCRSLQEIGRENEAEAFDRFDAFIKRLEDPTYYRSLPPDNRAYLLAGAHFARGSFAIFRARGDAALESAAALDASGMKLFAMIASQIRFLYYSLRAEFTKAAPHREQVELHAAHVGSVWQVETWEASALLLVYTATLSDIVSSTRLVHRIESMSRNVPSLRHYSRVAKHVLLLAREEEADYTSTDLIDYTSHEPRSYIGWAAAVGARARGYNRQGRHDEAKAICEKILSHVTDADREYPSLFLIPDIEMAIADAGLGQANAGLARLDALLTRFANCDHPLLHGLLHEARARICWGAGLTKEYARSLAEVERHFRPTGTPALIAMYERLAQLGAAAALPKAFSGAEFQPGNDLYPNDMDTDDIATRMVSNSETARAARRRSS